MENSMILTELKEIVHDLMDANGTFRVIPIGLVGNRNLPDSRIDMLKTLVTLLKDTKVITDETKLYIFNRHMPIKGVNEIINGLDKNNGKTVPLVTTKSKINYDRSKLERIFGKSMLGDIILKAYNDDKMQDYVTLMVNTMMKYNTDKIDLRDNIALNLDKSVLCNELSDEAFESFKLTILPYLKSHMKKLEETISVDCIGYFNYLLYNPVLSYEDTIRLDELKQLLEPSLYLDEQIDIE